jgi:GT2 family glycosyltransferase
MGVSITVAICTWNRSDALDRVLTAMRNLVIPEGVTWRLAVVNNNCTDRTDEVIAKHAPQLPLDRLFEPTPGISHARNCAVNGTQSDVILWIDDDAIPEPDWLAAHVTAFEQLKADLVIGKVVPLWEQGRPPTWYSPQFNGMFALLDYGDTTRVITDARETGFNVNMGFRRNLVQSVGAYRLDIGTGRRAGGEDQDLCQRAHDAGKVVVYQPQALVRHMIPPSRCTKQFYRRYMWSGSANHLKLLQDPTDASPRLFGLPRHFLRLNLGHFGRYVKAWLTFNTSDRFFYELKLVRLAGLFWHMFAKTDPLKYQKRIGE